MKRWIQALEMLRQQAQLVGAHRDRTAAAGRPGTPRTPLLQVTEPRGEKQEQEAASRAAQATRQRRRRPSRKQAQASHEQDVLGTLLHTDVASQQLAEKLWWKWRHVYLPAKQRELATRRATPAGDEAG